MKTTSDRSGLLHMTPEPVNEHVVYRSNQHVVGAILTAVILAVMALGVWAGCQRVDNVLASNMAEIRGSR